MSNRTYNNVMWVRFFVQGKSEAETYRWFEDDEPWGDADLRLAAEDWASGTSQGQLNDHYRYGFERVKKLPAAVKAALVVQFKSERREATRMLKILATVPTSRRRPARAARRAA
jgi:hypothetical protein